MKHIILRLMYFLHDNRIFLKFYLKHRKLKTKKKKQQNPRYQQYSLYYLEHRRFLQGKYRFLRKLYRAEIIALE